MIDNLSLERDDLEQVLTSFNNDICPDGRYASFDYCYNYFRTTPDLSRDIEKSCLAFGFYLASWGMLRGSSFLLQKSAKHFEPTINYISKLKRSVWEIDVDDYTDKSIEQIIKIYDDIKELLVLEGKTHVTLVTKALLGVFGFVPAFDNYFAKTFRDIAGPRCRFWRMEREALEVIRDFYQANRGAIDRWSAKSFTTDFSTGKKTNINYPKAKIVDMYGFQRALGGS